ncbi:hypothetical protein LT330_007723 [Penicillium expansum]|nr:hypothetical protein LT330_007723 [Penicillium expansum]KGO37603.1 hypothetical protein PEXP_082100 [Penicillium expansum]
MELPPHPPGPTPRGEIETLLLLQQQQNKPDSDTTIESDTVTNPTNTPDTPTTFPTSPMDSQESLFNLTAMPFLLLLHGADTLVFIDPSPETIRARSPFPAQTVPHRIHSEKLLATGSAYFKRLFNPQMQIRVRKRRGLTGKLPDGIQYVLDLTPPTLEEDAVIFLTELSCPMSIRTWASKQNMWSLPCSCVGGQDDLEPFEHLSQFSTTSPELGANGHSDHLESLRNDLIEAPFEPQDHFPESRPETVEQKGLPVEYSACRHREGIEHILHVLEGLNPKIDTPCKMWTFFALAKIFDVATVPAICDHIISWFYELNNTRFIELHPEVAYRVACGIRTPCLCRDAFVELVGDEALLYLIRATRFKPIGSMKDLVRSRISDILDDTEVQRIEYASKSFGDYVVRCFLQLTGSEMPWLAHIVEFQKLTRHVQLYPADQGIIRQLVMTLKEFIRGRIYGALIKGRDTNRSFHVAPNLVRSENPYHRWGIDKGFVLQRLIGESFWGALALLDLYQDEVPRLESHFSIAEIGNGSLAFGTETAARIRQVSPREVRQMIHVFNQAVRTRAQARHEEETLAARHAGGHVAMEVTINVRKSQSRNEVDSTSNGFFLNPIPAPTPNPCIPPVPPMPPKPDISADMFNEKTFKDEVHSFLRQYALEMLQQPGPSTMRHEVTDTLTCLTYNEFQYLPLWAGGNDDETGGVFTDLIIPAMDVGGFSAPGPAVHIGSVASTNDSLSEIGLSDAQSTIYGASHNATYSHASDIMSVDSTDYSQFKPENQNHESHDDMQSEAYMEITEYDDEISSLDLGLTTNDGEYETQSDGPVTVDMGSPGLSFASISENIEMEKVENEDNDTEFEFVDV